MATKFHSMIRQSLLANPFKWTGRKLLYSFLIGISAAAIIGAIQVSLRYDSNDSDRWFPYYFFNQLISWGQWIIWTPLFMLFITSMLDKLNKEIRAYLMIVLAVVGLALLAATVEGLLWHTFYNNSPDWLWPRVWKAAISNQFSFHFLFGLTIILVVAVRQLILISQSSKNHAPLVRSGLGALNGSLIIKHKGETEFIPLDQISHLSASGSYVEIYSDKGKTVITGTLKQFAIQLPEPQFVRIHRSFIVRVERVQKLTPLTNEDYKLMTTLGHELRVSRSYKSVLPLLKGSGLLNN